MNSLIKKIVSKSNYFYKLATLKVPDSIYHAILDWVMIVHNYELLTVELKEKNKELEVNKAKLKLTNNQNTLSNLNNNIKILNNEINSIQPKLSEIEGKLDSTPNTVTMFQGVQVSEYQRIFKFPIQEMPYVKEITDEVANYRLNAFLKIKDKMIKEYMEENPVFDSLFESKQTQKEIEKTKNKAEKRFEEEVKNLTEINNKLKKVEYIGFACTIKTHPDMPLNGGVDYASYLIDNDKTLIISDIIFLLPTSQSGRIEAQENIPSNFEERSEESYLRFLDMIVQHELRHAIQNYLSIVKGITPHSTGLGVRKTIDKDFDPLGQPNFSAYDVKSYNALPQDSKNWRLNEKNWEREIKMTDKMYDLKEDRIGHPYRDIEYQPKLADAALHFFNRLKQIVPNQLWIDTFKVFTSQISIDQYKSILKEAYNNKKINAQQLETVMNINPSLLVNDGFSSWKNVEPEKYKNALRELYIEAGL